jgi:hypothetical protein
MSFVDASNPRDAKTQTPEIPLFESEHTFAIGPHTNNIGQDAR